VVVNRGKIMTIHINIEELKQIFELLLERIKNDKIDFLDINADLYWIITSDEWNNFQSSPNPVVGSLLDDWNSLQEILKTQHIVTYLDYERFASILRIISETVAPSK
jgi:hypothetical protein